MLLGLDPIALDWIKVQLFALTSEIYAEAAVTPLPIDTVCASLIEELSSGRAEVHFQWQRSCRRRARALDINLRSLWDAMSPVSRRVGAAGVALSFFQRGRTMKLLHWIFLHLAAGSVKLAVVRMARAHAVLLATCIALLAVFAGLPAHADSAAAAEFTLRTCSDAMENFAKVDAAAREGNWQAASQPISEAQSKYMQNRSMWTVPQGDEIYFVSIWESLIGKEQKRPPQKVCAINFRKGTVRRDELFNMVSAATDLTFASETRTPQMRTERYEINRYRPNKVHITIVATLDGIRS